jgi:type IV pilus assembly protein PilQ
VDKIKDIIPPDLTRDVKIIEMSETNSLVLAGNMIGITKLKDFIRQIDKPVPVVLIEVTILDVTDSYLFSTGLKAGLSDGTTNAPPKTTTGSIYPGVDINLSTKAINSVVDGINGFGWIKLGNVSSNFYSSLKLMEDNSVVKIKSTPMLSTMNGHEASLSSGETRYYKEQRSDYIGTQNPTLTNSYSWKPLNADLTINIRPIVSGDGHITLDIQVQQSEFTIKASTDSDSPYNSVKRDFKSSIRVKDQEVILLGGLEKNKSEDSGSGLPLLSRLPVIKWFASSREKGKENTKLNIFIKPTVIY